MQQSTLQVFPHYFPMFPPYVIEILIVVALLLAITVCILVIILLVRVLSAVKKVDDFFSYFGRIRWILETFEGIPFAVVWIIKDFLFQFITKGGKAHTVDEDTITVKKRKK